MYGALRPMAYSAMRTRLDEFSIVETSDYLNTGCRVFRRMRLGLGTGDYYPFPYTSDNEIVTEPALAGILARFGIEDEEFMSEERVNPQIPVS